MRKPDSLAQMAQREGAFSENPEGFRGSFLIVTGTDCPDIVPIPTVTPAYGLREGRRGQVKKVDT